MLSEQTMVTQQLPVQMPGLPGKQESNSQHVVLSPRIILVDNASLHALHLRNGKAWDVIKHGDNLHALCR
jgi:hypothetical protein